MFSKRNATIQRFKIGYLCLIIYVFQKAYTNPYFKIVSQCNLEIPLRIHFILRDI